MTIDGRGYNQGSSSYSEQDVLMEQKQRDNMKALKEAKCTCKDAIIDGLPIDRCPVHGKML